jgi:polyisoprenoid-binding protein YceI
MQTIPTTAIKSTTKWTVDPAHSEIGFKVKHLVFSTVRGIFRDFEADILTNDIDFSKAEIQVRINPRSVDTNNEQRNAHLAGDDFFAADEFPEIRFTAGKFISTGHVATGPLAVLHPGNHVLHGDLTIKGITKPVELNIEFGGVIKDPWGKEKALFSLDGKINRKEWGLNYNAVLESGGLLISEDVWIHIELQLTRE